MLLAASPHAATATAAATALLSLLQAAATAANSARFQQSHTTRTSDRRQVTCCVPALQHLPVRHRSSCHGCILSAAVTHACVTTQLKLRSELWCGHLGGQDAEALLAGDALTAELVIWREAGWVGRLGGGAVWGNFLHGSMHTHRQAVTESIWWPCGKSEPLHGAPGHVIPLTGQFRA